MSADSLSPQIIGRVLSEIKGLVKCSKQGDPEIEYIECDDNSISEVHCYIHGPADTPYFGGKFRVKLILQNDYPAAPPRGYFLTKIFHPNVSNNGDICVNTLKRDWKPTVTLTHIFQIIRCLLIIPFPESSLNDEAGKLFMESFGEFAKRARIMTKVHAIPTGKSEASAASSATPATVPVKCAGGGAKGDNSSDSAENDVNVTNTSETSSADANGVTTVFSVVDANLPASSSGSATEKVAEGAPVKLKKAGTAAKDAKKKSLKRL